MIDRESFFNEFPQHKEYFDSLGINWSILEAIHDDYLKVRNECESIARTKSDELMKLPKVHSVRYRTKDPYHLIEKLIRNFKKEIDTFNKVSEKSSTSPKGEKGKSRTKPKFNITVENYKNKVKDLIGLRAIHLYKNDWIEINEELKSKENIIGSPIAYYREGDDSKTIKIYQDKGCDVTIHPYNYRSVHYNLETTPRKNTFIVEVQVRTIFEEGWSEIDHNVRYPYKVNDEILTHFLSILNRIAGSADEMGTFINILLQTQDDYIKRLEEKENALTELSDEINHLKISGEQKNNIIKKLKEASQQITSNPITPHFVGKGIFDGLLGINHKQLNFGLSNIETGYDENGKLIFLPPSNKK